MLNEFEVFQTVLDEASKNLMCLFDRCLRETQFQDKCIEILHEAPSTMKKWQNNVNVKDEIFALLLKSIQLLNPSELKLAFECLEQYCQNTEMAHSNVKEIAEATVYALYSNDINHNLIVMNFLIVLK